ncbi:signal peptidase I [Microbacterium sp. C7(2022)]|uniref:signal peptidase I n=1 Tax=Microbacterium sp. C7(2022) TaxID=2992759 RepID=UPI00237BDAA4|nr:signal peptidase I [Microbacterium sp. C7(2022)]MDE0545356.1 signal peptidase I [Microbacterium sp. C7(2022)]
MTDARADEPRPLWRRITSSLWFQLVAAFVVTGLILSFVGKPYWVPSGSMEETLQPGDRILVNRLAYVGANPGAGDIVVFDADDAWDTTPIPATDPLRGALRWIGEVTGFGPSGAHTLVKRIIGTPGQSVECCDADGAIVVDGAPLDEPYVFNDFAFEPGSLDCDTTPASLRCFDEVIVPEGRYLMLGDNRAGSSDSAIGCRVPDASPNCWRWASDGAIVGKAAVILWPISRWGGL